jgi:hypothetical protein
MCSSDRKNDKIDALSSDNKRLRCERDNVEDTLHKEQRALRDSQQRADEKLSNMELLLATRDTALKMQERATEQLEEENTKLYEKCRILRNISRELEGTMKAREKRAVMRLIDDLAAVAKRKYEDIEETSTEDPEDRSIIPPQPPLPRQIGTTAASSSVETLPMLPSHQELPTPAGVPTVMQPTSPAPTLLPLPAPEPASTNRDDGASSASYSSDSDTERANDDKHQEPTANAEARATLLEAPAATAIEPGDVVV